MAKKLWAPLTILYLNRASLMVTSDTGYSLLKFVFICKLWHYIRKKSDWKEKTERHKLLSARGMLAKMAANGIRTHACSPRDPDT